MDGKSNEIPALSKLVELVDVRGRTVTADALRPQRGMAAAIENADARIGRPHWVLDVSMDEDQARNRKGNSAACLAVVRRLALNIVRMHPDKRSIRRKFTRAQRDDNFLLDMIRRIRKRE